jgi:hypothetical protein
MCECAPGDYILTSEGVTDMSIATLTANLDQQFSLERVAVDPMHWGERLVNDGVEQTFRSSGRFFMRVVDKTIKKLRIHQAMLSWVKGLHGMKLVLMSIYIDLRLNTEGLPLASRQLAKMDYS